MAGIGGSGGRPLDRLFRLGRFSWQGEEERITIEASTERLAHVENIAQQDAAERAFNRLVRTFAAQMEALKRYSGRRPHERHAGHAPVTTLLPGMKARCRNAAGSRPATCCAVPSPYSVGRRARSRACHQLSQTTLATSWTAARKFRAVFS